MAQDADLSGDAGARASWSQTPLSGRERGLSAAVGALAAGGGTAAVFLTNNEVGSAALLAVGVYFLVTAILARFPRLIIGGNEIDPGTLREVKEQSDAAKEQSDDAKVNSEDAQDGLADTRKRVAALEAAVANLSGDSQRAGERESPAVQPQSPPEAPQLDERLVDLAQQYNEVRWTMPSGNERTRRMTSIVDSMIAICREVDVQNVDELLSSPDRGIRLAGVAYLNAHPDARYVDALAKVALTPDKPFNEYWALLTLRKVLQGNCDRLVASLRLRLQQRLREVAGDTDRAREIQRILAECP